MLQGEPYFTVKKIVLDPISADLIYFYVLILYYWCANYNNLQLKQYQK
jgi:hypothetical protein